MFPDMFQHVFAFSVPGPMIAQSCSSCGAVNVDLFCALTVASTLARLPEIVLHAVYHNVYHTVFIIIWGVFVERFTDVAMFLNCASSAFLAQRG